MQIISGLHKGKKLFCPKSFILRPTSSRMRGTIFNICQNETEGSTFLDLFAGIGAMGLEALSRGALHTTFVEMEKMAISYIQKNVQKVREEPRCSILMMDVFQALSWLNDKHKTFDLIFADPPYGKEGEFLSNRVLSFVDSCSLLKLDGNLFLEDDIDSEQCIPILTRLKLKSARSVGRTLLRHYTY